MTTTYGLLAPNSPPNTQPRRRLSDNVQLCTASAPHVCRKYGACNGWPRAQSTPRTKLKKWWAGFVERHIIADYPFEGEM